MEWLTTSLQVMTYYLRYSLFTLELFRVLSSNANRLNPFVIVLNFLIMLLNENSERLIVAFSGQNIVFLSFKILS